MTIYRSKFRDMKVLIACEESQIVTKEFRKLGFLAYSCDIQECSGGKPEWHIQADVLDVIYPHYLCRCGHRFNYSLGKYGCPNCCGDKVAKYFAWDAMIAFPPCTHLAKSGARWFKKKKKAGLQKKAIDFFMSLVMADIQFIAIENPIGVMSTEYRKPDQIVNPYDFGDPAQKPTCLWLKNLPKLAATNLGDAPLFGEKLCKGDFHTTSGGKTLPKWYNLPPGPDRSKIRSKTFPGIANAMAIQWGAAIQKQLEI